MAVSSGLEIQPKETGAAGEQVGPFLHPGKELRAQRGWVTPRCHQACPAAGRTAVPRPEGAVQGVVCGHHGGDRWKQGGAEVRREWLYALKMIRRGCSFKCLVYPLHIVSCFKSFFFFLGCSQKGKNLVFKTELACSAKGITAGGFYGAEGGWLAFFLVLMHLEVKLQTHFCPAWDPNLSTWPVFLRGLARCLEAVLPWGPEDGRCWMEPAQPREPLPPWGHGANRTFSQS